MYNNFNDETYDRDTRGGSGNRPGPGPGPRPDTEGININIDINIDTNNCPGPRPRVNAMEVVDADSELEQSLETNEYLGNGFGGGNNHDRKDCSKVLKFKCGIDNEIEVKVEIEVKGCNKRRF